jgi:hypothetical protein
MRIGAIITVVMLGWSVVFGQSENLIEGNIESGGFGGPVLKITPLAGATGVLVGGRGGWIINHTFVVGGGGYGLVNNILADTPGPNGGRYIDFGYGGVELEYIMQSERLVHFSVGVLIGGGGVGYRDEYNATYGDSRGFFVMEPWGEVHLNIVRFFRISAGASYRWVTGADSPVASDSRLSGVAGILTFRFGSF